MFIQSRDRPTLGQWGAIPPPPPKLGKKYSTIYKKFPLKNIFLAPFLQNLYILTHEN